MEERISADEVDRDFPRVLAGVKDGKSYVVTSGGLAVAKIVPVGEAATDQQSDRLAARDRLLEWLSAQPKTKIEPWTREELYEDGN